LNAMADDYGGGYNLKRDVLTATLSRTTMMAAAPEQQFQFHHSSPLDTLVRKTSARKPSQQQTAREERRWPQQQQQQGQGPLTAERQHYQGLPRLTTERQPYQAHHAAPSSPLLHSHFNRQSTATWGTSDNDTSSSYLDLGDSNDPGYVVQELDYGDYDVSSPGTDHTTSPALRDSWQSSGAHTIRPGIDDEPAGGAWAGIPTVMVSEPSAEHMGYATTRAGKTPIIRPTTANFSRPARSAVEVPHAWENEQKQRVLERNASRRTAPNTPDTQYSGFALPVQGSSSRPDSSASSVYSQASQSQPHSQSRLDASQPGSRSQSRSPEPLRAPGEPVHLLRRPPSLRAGSPVSLYSEYSFYQLDSATPSPTTDKQFSPVSAPPQPSQLKRVEFAPSSPRSPRSPTPSASPAGSRTAQEFLQLGIAHHEADRLPESAAAFERAATLDGGCGVGMLMWGLALRHGWGCTKNEKSGFKWLRRAAEHAVSDLESARKGGAIDGAVETELVLAIYEVGQCFFHGWGIPKDQKMGVSYYAVAARMGDADAQMDLGFCLANGKGVKKDRKEAAKWYRAAVKQGQSDIGLAWIYKEKLQ
jgi:TPR repeat protein